MRVKVGDNAPDFTLTSQNGEEVTLSQFLSKKNIVLFFYPKDESPICTRQVMIFKDNFKIFTKLDAEVLGVNSGSIKSHKAFAEHHKLPFMLLSDKDKKVKKLYGVSSSLGIISGRVTYIIDKKGVVRNLFSSQLQLGKHVEEAKKILETIKEKSF